MSAFQDAGPIRSCKVPALDAKVFEFLISCIALAEQVPVSQMLVPRPYLAMSSVGSRLTCEVTLEADYLSKSLGSLEHCDPLLTTTHGK